MKPESLSKYMASTGGIQEQFIQLIKDKLPARISLVDEIADLLNISNDSAYRRIRGETLLTIDEFLLLSNRFNISLDGLSGKGGDYVTFQYLPINYKNYSIQNLFDLILRDFQEASKVENAELFYLARDMPVFYLLQIDEIRSFKIFLWQKLHRDPNLTMPSFHPDQVDSQMMSAGKMIWDYFVKFPSTEIWGIPTFESLLDEIGFMWDSAQIADKEIALKLCDKAAELMEHVRKQAELGYKFSYGLKPVERKNNLKLYCADFLLTHNKVLIEGDIRRVYIPTSLDTLITSDQNYFERNIFLFENLKSKSSLISETGEKERNRFIERCLALAENLRHRINAT